MKVLTYSKLLLLRVIPALTYCFDILFDTLFGILSDIYTGVAHSIRSWRYGVRVQAWPTASGAGDVLFGSRRGRQHPELAMWCSGPCVPKCIRSWEEDSSDLCMKYTHAKFMLCIQSVFEWQDFEPVWKQSENGWIQSVCLVFTLVFLLRLTSD